MDETQEAREDAPLFELATAQDFADSGLDEILAELGSADRYALEAALRAGANAAAASGDLPRKRVLGLVAALLSCHLRTDDPAEPFGPMLMIGSRRSIIPSDVRGEQAIILSEVAPGISHPVVRARLGDVAFLTSRRHHIAGRSAMEAYCAQARLVIDGSMVAGVPGIDLGMHDVVKPIVRAIDLMKLLHRTGERSQVVSDTLLLAWQVARNGGAYVPAVELGYAGLSIGVLQAPDVALAADDLASGAPATAYPEAVKRVWLLAAYCYGRLGKTEDETRCRLSAAEQTLSMRDQCSGALAKAHWTKQAVAEMREIPGTRDRVRELLDEMRHFQLSARDEASSFSMPMDLTEERKESIALFEGVTLPDAFIQLMAMAGPPKRDELRTVAVEADKGSIVDEIIGSSTYLDAEGKEIARTTAPGGDEEGSETWVKSKCVQYMSIIMHQQVHGKIEPARRTLLSRFSVEERHIGPIVHMSPFVPPGYEQIFALGFARLFQGDYVSAAHILIPQLENSLRHMLVMANADPTKIESDLLQGDRALGALLDVNRADLEAMWGPDVVHQIDILFNFRPGPSLRNEIAHGKLPWGAFHTAEMVFGCWFVFNLACRPMLRQWREMAASAIEMQI